MELKVFFTYIGSLVVISIALTILVKSLAEGFASQGKKPILYGSFSALVVSVMAYLTLFISENLFTVYWILVGIFFIFGIVHYKLVQFKYFYHSESNKGKVFAGEIFYSLSIMLFTIAIFSSLQYFMTDFKNFIFYPMMLSTLGFFIPGMFMRTFDAAFNIPPSTYPTWTYPIYNPIDLPPEDPREKILVIGFEIAKKSSEAKKTYFRAKAPEMIRLGELYYFFTNDYNDLQSETPIEYANAENIPYEWWFRLKKKWYQGNRILDPMMSVRENGIKENSVIICERLSDNVH